MLGRLGRSAFCRFGCPSRVRVPRSLTSRSVARERPRRSPSAVGIRGRKRSRGAFLPTTWVCGRNRSGRARTSSIGIGARNRPRGRRGWSACTVAPLTWYRLAFALSLAVRIRGCSRLLPCCPGILRARRCGHDSPLSSCGHRATSARRATPPPYQPCRACVAR